MFAGKCVLTFALLALIGCNSSESTSASTNTQEQSYPDYGFPWKSGVAYGTYKDLRDENRYRTIIINQKEWMAENLRFNDGVSSCYWNTGSNYCEKFGRLYMWPQAMDTTSQYNLTLLNPNPTSSQGACPNGWRIPSEYDWAELENYAGGPTRAGVTLKSTTGWLPISGALITGIDSIGFRVVPSGYKDSLYKPFDEGLTAAYWTSNEFDRKFAKARIIQSDLARIIDSSARKSNKFSIRCIRDL